MENQKENPKQAKLNPNNNQRPKDISFRGIVSEPEEKFVAIAFPSQPKGDQKSPFLGLTFGAIKNMRESFDSGEFELPVNHKFKEWDRVVVTIKTRLIPMMHIETDNEVSFPIVIIQAGEKWISGIFPLKEEESAQEDFTYDLPIKHPFKPYDELILTIKKVGT